MQAGQDAVDSQGSPIETQRVRVDLPEIEENLTRQIPFHRGEGIQGIVLGQTSAQHGVGHASQMAVHPQELNYTQSRDRHAKLSNTQGPFPGKA